MHTYMHLLYTVHRNLKHISLNLLADSILVSNGVSILTLEIMLYIYIKRSVWMTVGSSN